VNDVDPFVRARPICEALGGISRRCLYDRVKRGDFPPPDRAAQRRGEPDLWRASTVKRGLDQYATGSNKEVA
jgi:hypothetical protein